MSLLILPFVWPERLRAVVVNRGCPSMCAWVRYILLCEDDFHFTFGLRCPPKHLTSSHPAT
eukprot:1996320-Prymnesium_polylepis.1